VSTVGLSAQELAAESGAALRDSGGTGSPPNFTDLFAGDLTAARNPAGQEELSPSAGAVFSTHGADSRSDAAASAEADVDDVEAGKTGLRSRRSRVCWRSKS
jgi:hypothetical protein